jgi:ubiquitin C-terminal hydrolase
MALYLSYLSIAPHAVAFEQSDVSEFFHFIINELHKLLPNSLAIESDMFQGSLTTDRFCYNCPDKASCTTVPFIELQTVIPSMKLTAEYFKQPTGWRLRDIDIVDCLRSRFKDTISECKSCGGELVEQVGITRLPKILGINLNRVRMDGSKVTSLVHVSPEIDISDFYKPNNQIATQYRLCGIIVHRGGRSSGGHYSCYIPARRDMWMHMDDAIVKSCGTLDNVLVELGNRSKNSQACMVFYRRNEDGNLERKGTSKTHRYLAPGSIS